MDKVKVLKQDVMIQGLTKSVVIVVEVEDDDVDFAYWDTDLANETKRDLEANKVLCHWIQVRASFSDLAGFEGVDSLGQVFSRPSAMTKDILQSVNDHGMIQNAIDDLVAQVLQGKDTLDQFLKGA